MAMTQTNNRKNLGFALGCIEEYVPEDHIVRKLEEALDWNFIYPLVRPLYSSTGRPSVDPVVLFKMIFINYTFGINSMRKTCEEIKVNLAYRWFLGIPMDEAVPNYSTWSQNYIRRYGDSEVFDRIFEKIIEQGIEYGYIHTETVFGDSTHQKASANRNKSIRKEVEVTKKVYEDDLLAEINEERRKHNKQAFDSLKREEYEFDEDTGEAVIVTETKDIKESVTDPDSGNFHKGKHEECFAYSHQTFCDRNGFVIMYETVPGNVHDSISFCGAYAKLIEKYEVHNISLDAGYKTPAIARMVAQNGQKLFIPYTRPKTKNGLFSKTKYTYDNETNQYICPAGQILKYSTTNRNGYHEYKSSPSVCADCPHLEQCTRSQNHQKAILRHVWQGYLDEAENRRHSEEWKEIYPKRKETIERAFGDCKENHGLRYTRVRGLKKNSHQAAIIFSCHNLKRMGLWRWKYTHQNSNIC